MANSKGTTGRSKKPSSKKNVKTPIPIDGGASQQTASTSIPPDTTPLAQQFPGIEEEIRVRAYELYEERGRQEGLDHEDWARAEIEILGRYSKKEKTA